MKSKFFKFLLLLLIVGVSIDYAFSYIYARGHSPWDDDYRFLSSLDAGNVDGIRVYKTRNKGKKWYSLKEVSRKEVVFETKDKRRIKEFVWRQGM
jgi:hypothetical protein